LRFLALTIAALALAAGAWGQPAPKKRTAAAAKTKAKVVPHAAASKSTTTKSVASRPAVSKTASKAGTKSRKTAVVRRPPTQQQPTADRYKEIQQALMDKGYFQGPVDGAWNPGSVDALKRFQKDQNLDADGKIGSLSLIALGLGPKRGVASAQAAPAASETVVPPAVQPQQ